ncbi:MAG: hypothetical protein IH951_11700 [Bacteroidetes bacterium]|nr:hypothetical protein [Bacteroidota bacterium]
MNPQRMETLFSSLIMCGTGLVLLWMGTDVLMTLTLERTAAEKEGLVMIIGVLMYALGLTQTFLGAVGAISKG